MGSALVWAEKKKRKKENKRTYHFGRRACPKTRAGCNSTTPAITAFWKLLLFVRLIIDWDWNILVIVL